MVAKGWGAVLRLMERVIQPIHHLTPSLAALVVIGLVIIVHIGRCRYRSREMHYEREALTPHGQSHGR